MGFFNMRAWRNRVTQFPTRRKITIESQSATQITGAITRDEGTITDEGDALDATNLNDLENRINTAFDAVETDIDGLTTETTETADKLDVLWKLSKGIIYDWQKTEVDGVVTVPSGAKSSVLQGLKGKTIAEDNELKSSSVTKFTISGTDYPITFSGKSARTVRDEIDLVNKKYIQRVGSVDLGTLTWSTDGNSIWTSMGLSELIKSPASDGTIANVIIALYTAVTSYQINSGDKIVAVNTVKRLRIRDTDFANASAFKAAMDGVMLYYELATPIETDITQEEITAITASGDTIIFDGDIEVGSIFNHFIALNEVNV